MKSLLVVVDMVNGFVNEGALADKKINKITQNIIKCIEKAKQKGIDIVAFKDCHSMEDEEFQHFPPHCLKGTNESELIPELLPYQEDMCIINKNTTNGFNTKMFRFIADTFDYDKVYVVGCCTDICVQAFVSSYLRYIKENNKQTEIIVYEDACYTFDGEKHNAQKCHERAIAEMEEIGATIKSVNNYNKNIEV